MENKTEAKHIVVEAKVYLDTKSYRIKGGGGREQDSQKSLNFIHSIKVISWGEGYSTSTFYSVKSCTGYSSV